MKPDSITCQPVFIRDVNLGYIIVARKGNNYYFHASPHDPKPVVFPDGQAEVIAKLSMKGKYSENYWVRFDSSDFRW
jgi:hypothetical protein